MNLKTTIENRDLVDSLTNEINKTLYPTRDDLEAQGRKAKPPLQIDEFEIRETRVVMSLFSAVMQLGLTPAEMDRMRDKAVREAGRLTRLRKDTKVPKGAIWWHWFHKYIEREVGPKRWKGAIA